MTPEQRSLVARIAAHERWGREADPTAATEHGRRAFLDRFEREADPDGVMSPTDRAKAAESARQAWYARRVLAMARARRNRRTAENRRTKDEFHVPPGAPHDPG